MRQLRVCVADDCEETAAVLCEGLRLNQYEAASATSGSEALEICRKGGIDLILLDICLPDMDGYEVCRRLKEDPKTRDIAVIFVTVKGSAESIAQGYELGAVDYIKKPFNLPMVMVRVEAAIRNSLQHAEAEAEPSLFSDNTYTDQLTGLRNRQFLLERLTEEMEKAQRYQYPVSCVVFDVDDVQAVDDELGPVSMDDLLVELAMSIRNYSRTSDVVARYDGSVFAALLPHCSLGSAVCYAGKIMDEVDSTTFSDPNYPTVARLSVGIATCQSGHSNGPEGMLGEAMRSLLQAKSCTKQRIVARNLADAQPA